MSYPGGGYPPYTQYGNTNNQFATTYTPIDQPQNQYGMPAYNQYTTPYQQNTAQYNPHSAPYAQGNSVYNPYIQSNTQVGVSYPQSGSYRQGPSTNTQGGQYSHVAPPYNADESTSSPKQPSYKQAPPPSYNQAPPPTYNQAPPQEKSPSFQPSPYQQQGPTYSQATTYPQQDSTYPQQQYPQGPSFTPNDPAYQPGGDTTSYHQPTYGPTIGPQKPPKRPHMPHKFHTSFKQGPAVKKTAARPPQPMPSMQPLQGGKSAVCSIHDVAFQNGYTINWFEQSETGPAHAKVFSMKVTMGPYEVLGSGRSKKLAKQDAAQLLMAQVQGNTVADIMGLPGFTGNAGQTGNTSQSSNTSEDYGPQLPPSEKTTSEGVSGGGEDNPISMLDHVAKKHRLGDPQYISVCENGPLALQRFDIKVKVNDMEASGLGRSKKVAKRNAATAMLDQLSRTKVGIQPPKKRIKFVKASSETTTTES